MTAILTEHQCVDCPETATLLRVLLPTTTSVAADFVGAGQAGFPPRPASVERQAECVRDWNEHVSGDKVFEHSCAVCACLFPRESLEELPADAVDLSPLVCEGAGVTRRYRETAGDPIQDIAGPVVDELGTFEEDGRQYVRLCRTCRNVLRRGEMPAAALANGRWIGPVPRALQGLSYAEELLVSPVRRNKCVAYVTRGRQRYLKANVLLFEQPVVKVYDELPPPRQELEETLAILFSGRVKPADEEFRDTPLMVRHKVVMDALHCLSLNHSGFEGIRISPENMATYSDNEPVVCVVYRPPGADAGHAGESLAVYEKEDEEEDCAFVVRALTGPRLARMTYNERLAFSIKYFEEGGKALSIGHEDVPESMYHNADLYPKLFPWLYPYGLGGFENTLIKKRFDRLTHVRAQLMYSDRRFQTDRTFPFVAFSHEQMRASYTGGYLLTKRRNFPRVAEKLLSVDVDALDRLIARSKKTGYAAAEDDAERACFELMSIIDHVAGHVAGTNTRRKWQRNELRSLTYAHGTPTFFLTFAPADTKSPICLAMCGHNVDLTVRCPPLPDEWTRIAAVAKNPVGAARYFHHMVEGLLKCVLRVGDEKAGIFGPVESYYGTVEEQGRKTLHLHLLVWIKGGALPLEIREQVMSDERFRTDLILWLESCHTGDFYSGTESSLSEDLEIIEPDQLVNGVFRKGKPRLKVRDPATMLAGNPPSQEACKDPCVLASWYKEFRRDADEIVFASNRHSREHDKGCLRGDPVYCRARFPRELVEQTKVDLSTGAVRFMKHEQWINTYHPVMAVLCRCNTDVTCLLSGTAIQEVIAYVADYITKSVLTTHKFFLRIGHVVRRNEALMSDDVAGDRQGRARKLVTKMVNSLVAGAEIGGPFACSSLLGLPDHYTNHQFKTVYWYTYVRKVLDDSPIELRLRVEQWRPTVESSEEERVLVGLSQDGVVPLSKTNDYVYRPIELEDMCLYDFLTGSDVRPLRGKQEFATEPDGDLSQLSDSESENFQQQKCKRQKERPLRFREGHPEQQKCGVFLLASSSRYVLNFTGGTLPRRDKGNQEEYALTMLVLFAPGGWRKGADLLRDRHSWLSVLQNTTFATEHQTVMRNMMALYECLDARDDYSTLRRQGALPSLDTPMVVDVVDGSGPDVDNVHIHGEEGENLDDLLVDEDRVEGKTTALNNKEASHMHHLLRRLHRGCQQESEAVMFHPTPSTVYRWSVPPSRSPATWKQLVQAVRTKVIEQRRAGSGRAADQANPFPPGRPYAGQISLVSIVSKADLERMANFGLSPSSGIQDANLRLLHSTLQSYSLNNEQSRAFFIIARHLHHHENEPLRMLLTGMAGTGKSRVVMALVDFLTYRGEEYRFLVLGPTGQSASLIGGSTYHSVLGFGFNDDGNLPEASIDKIRERLSRVCVIFIDEVSMISCEALFRIFYALVSAFGPESSAFGGKSLVFAGDFAQLMPAGRGHALYSDNVVAAKSVFTTGGQTAALGKAVWHTITVVVILRENMRQTSSEDEAFRKCLAHMRYARCDAEDIRLLRTRVFKVIPPEFADVAMITARNAYRDVINDVYAKQFAQQTGRTLHTFYSLDHWGSKKNTKSIRAALRAYDSTFDPKRSNDSISPTLQRVLWALRPSLTNHHAGKLLLCEGMPVLLKTNEATELGATNGAQAVVVGWDSHSTADGKEVLDTLFVRLTKVTKPVQIEGLPLNVIPLPRTRQATKCILPVDDIQLSIQREQVTVLGYFALTDYGSQGGTRLKNVVYMKHCSNHQSIYTCLSRSSSLAGTVIVDDFDSSKIQRGASRALQTEFRDLELLDEITTLTVEDRLPAGVEGTTRYDLINSFLAVMGSHHIPSRADRDIGWRTTPNTKSAQRKADVSESFDSDRREKRRRVTDAPVNLMSPRNRQRPRENWQPLVRESALAPVGRPGLTRTGLIWNAVDHSCGYDAFFTLLWQLRIDCGPDFVQSIALGNIFTATLTVLFANLDPFNVSGLEFARDGIRDMLSAAFPALFPRRGPVGISMSDLLSTMLALATPTGVSMHRCNQCTYETIVHTEITDSAFWTLPTMLDRLASTDVIALRTHLERFMSEGFATGCPVCSTEAPVISSLHRAPPLLGFQLPPEDLVELDDEIRIPVIDELRSWTLCGIIYHGSNHYIHRYIDGGGRLWFHDGQRHGGRCIMETDARVATDLLTCGGNRACYVIYRLKTN